MCNPAFSLQSLTVQRFSFTWVGMLSARLLWGSLHAADPLLLVDGFPEGLGHLSALESMDNLMFMQEYKLLSFQCSAAHHSWFDQKLTWVNSSKVSWLLVLVSSWMISRILYPGRAKLAALKSSFSSSLVMKPFLSTSGKQTEQKVFQFAEYSQILTPAISLKNCKINQSEMSGGLKYVFLAFLSRHASVKI